MAYTAEQEARISAANSRNDLAKQEWAKAVAFWNQHFVNLKCYFDTKYPAEAGATWFTPNDSSCNQGREGCKNSDKDFCKVEIALIRSNIGSIRNAYIEKNAAQTNYDRVVAEIDAEIASDPEIILEKEKINAEASQTGKRYIFYGIVVVVIAFLVFAYFKWFRK